MFTDPSSDIAVDIHRIKPAYLPVCGSSSGTSPAHGSIQIRRFHAKTNDLSHSSAAAAVALLKQLENEVVRYFYLAKDTSDAVSMSVFFVWNRNRVDDRRLGVVSRRRREIRRRRRSISRVVPRRTREREPLFSSVRASCGGIRSYWN